MVTIRKKRGKSSSKAKEPKLEPELAHQILMRSMNESRERLCEEEIQLRQRIIDEERRVIDDALSRESNIRTVILENELKAKYEELRKDMMDSIMKRDWDLQLVQGKLTGMEKAQEFLMKEKETALQLASKLQDQLDLAQTMFFEEREMLKSRINKLEKDCRDSTNESIEYQAHIRKLEESNRNKQAAFDASSKELIVSQTPDSPTSASASASGTDATGNSDLEEDENEEDFSEVDKETAALVEVLRREVEVYKEQIANLQNKLHSKNRDEEKTSLLVAVLNTQLESVREENKHLRETAQKRMDDIKSMQDFVQSEREKYFALLGKAENAGSEASVKQTQLQLELDVHKKQVIELTSSLEKVTNERNALTKKHEEYVENAINREREDFRANTSMKALVEKHQDEKERLLEANKKAQDDMFNYKVLTRAEMDSLKSRLHTMQEILDQKEQEIVKVTRTLSSENEQLKAERDQLWATWQTKTQSMEEERQSLINQRDALAEELKNLRKSSAETEKQLYENLVIMTACHDSKKEELEREQARSRERDKEYNNNIVFLRADNGNLKTKMSEILASAEQREKEDLERITHLERQIGELNSKIAVEYIQRDETLAKAVQRADLAERNVRRLQNQLQEAHENSSKKAMESSDVVKALRADARELKSELDLAKRTIERLEGDIGDRANYKHLATMNEHLTEELAGYRAQVDRLREELRIAQEDQRQRGSSIEKMVEAGEKARRRAEGLERAQALLSPLLAALRARVGESAGGIGDLSDGLREALERYDAAVEEIARPIDCPACGRPLPTSTRTTTTTAADEREGEGADLRRTLPAVLQPRPAPSLADGASAMRMEGPCKPKQGIPRYGRYKEVALPQINTL
ncbi:unnamed protein product [Phytomonas sp. EM1]|nr:unnamed protein product [Phytomonas sp. EM1]|eukprot:CCW63337.1 unnamed protein product [Phytomonas sp. isolate EM1]